MTPLAVPITLTTDTVYQMEDGAKDTSKSMNLVWFRI
jgi:hypothetical protein